MWKPVSRIISILPQYVPGRNREHNEKTRVLDRLFKRKREGVKERNK